MREVSIRDRIVDKIAGEIEKMFAPLAEAPPADKELTAMEDLEKVLVLLSDVDSFYSYSHEADATPAFSSFSGFLGDTDNKGADQDPRATEEAACKADPPTSACQGLAIRLRSASFACDAYAIPPGSFDGQPSDPIPGLSSVVASINSYESTGSLTSVSCISAPDGSRDIVVAQAPKCKTYDKGVCSAMCSVQHSDLTTSDGSACVASCTGGTHPSGIDSTDIDKYCPPIAALRAVQRLATMTEEDIFVCYDFDCGTASTLSDLSTCAVPGAKGYSVPIKSKACTLSELAKTFDDAADKLRASIADVEKTADDMKPTIAGDLQTLMYDKLVNPFLEVINAEKMDCSFLGEMWRKFLDGGCYNLGSAIAQYATIFNFCSQCGFLLVFLMFGLWRHFITMYDAAAKEAKTVAVEEEGK